MAWLGFFLSNSISKVKPISISPADIQTVSDDAVELFQASLLGEDHRAQPEDVSKPEVDDALGRLVVSASSPRFLKKVVSVKGAQFVRK